MGGMPSEEHTVSREWPGGPTNGDRLQGHQDGLVLEKTMGKELLKAI